MNDSSGTAKQSEQSAGKGRPKGDHEARKMEIAEATWRVIAEKGLSGATVRSIARETGYSTGVLSHYFRNKSEILEFAVECLFVLWLKEYNNKLETAETAAEELRYLVESLLPMDEISKFFWTLWMRFLTEASHNLQYSKLVIGYQVQMRERIAGIVQRGVAEGIFRSDVDSPEMLDILNAIMDGLSITSPFEQEYYQPDYVQRIIDRILDIIVVKHA
jgi:AcrR family transcriptional regulator